MFIGQEAARLFACLAASCSDTHPELDLKLARAANVFASETANRLVNDAMQILGGIGYCKGMVTEKAFRDQRVTPFIRGTNEAQRFSLSRMTKAGN